MTLARLLILVAVVQVAAILLVNLDSSCRCGRGCVRPSPVGSLRTLLSAQLDYRLNDRDANGVTDYWTRDVQGLYAIKSPDGAGIKLIEVTIARADASPCAGNPNYVGVPEPAPKAGYWYAIIPLNENGKRFNGKNGFAYCIFPDSYGSSGKLTYIMNHRGEVWKRDLGGDPVLRWPRNPEANGWESAE